MTNDSDGSFKCLDHVSHSHNYSLFKNTLPESFSGPYLILNRIKVNGQTYRSRICVVMRLEELLGEMLPVFGMIDNIIKNVNGQVCLIMNAMHTTHHLLLPFRGKMLKYIKYINLMVLFIILALSHIKKIVQDIFYISCIKVKVGITPFGNSCLVHRNFEVLTIEMVHPPIPTLVPTPKLWLMQP